MNLPYTVNQQILAAIKFGVSQNKVIWRLAVYAVYDQRTITYIGATNICENMQFTKYNSTPKFVDLQYDEGVCRTIRNVSVHTRCTRQKMRALCCSMIECMEINLKSQVITVLCFCMLQDKHTFVFFSQYLFRKCFQGHGKVMEFHF